MIPILLIPFTLFTKTTLAWGALAHETIAFLATPHLLPATLLFTTSLLGDTSPTHLATVATWADMYRATAAGHFSAPFHFIDAQDNPPVQCGVDYARDCGAGGCVVRAVGN